VQYSECQQGKRIFREIYPKENKFSTRYVANKIIFWSDKGRTKNLEEVEERELKKKKDKDLEKIWKRGTRISQKKKKKWLETLSKKINKNRQ
jgi:hypothetical protein